jgi:hypothetical protein
MWLAFRIVLGAFLGVGAAMTLMVLIVWIAGGQI